MLGQLEKLSRGRYAKLSTCVCFLFVRVYWAKRRCTCAIPHAQGRSPLIVYLCFSFFLLASLCLSLFLSVANAAANTCFSFLVVSLCLSIRFYFFLVVSLCLFVSPCFSLLAFVSCCLLLFRLQKKNQK